MEGKRGSGVFLFCAGVLALGAQGDDLQELERRMKAEYEGKVVTVRGFYAGGRLRYNPEGELVRGGRAGPWTLNGKVQVTRVKLRPHRLEIEGHRLFLVYRGDTFGHLRSAQKVQIELALLPDGATEETLQRLLARVFLSKTELAKEVPSY